MHAYIHPCIHTHRWLLSLGALVDARDHTGNTPLHHAARAGKEDAVKALVKAGAKGGVNWEGKGYTPAELAAGNPELSVWLTRKMGVPTHSH